MVHRGVAVVVAPLSVTPMRSAVRQQEVCPFQQRCHMLMAHLPTSCTQKVDFSRRESYPSRRCCSTFGRSWHFGLAGHCPACQTPNLSNPPAQKHDEFCENRGADRLPIAGGVVYRSTLVVPDEVSGGVSIVQTNPSTRLQQLVVQPGLQQAQTLCGNSSSSSSHSYRDKHLLTSSANVHQLGTIVPTPVAGI